MLIVLNYDVSDIMNEIFHYLYFPEIPISKSYY